MGIRIQPRDFDFPELHKFAPNPEGPDLDPFQGDLLDRKAKIEVLTRLVGNIEGPCAMAVDAAWGAGKTTFLKMWARHLCQQGFPVVEFNAWETDFTGDPFVALSSEITGGLTEWNAPTVADKIKETKETARKVLRWVAPGAIRLASGFIPVVGNEFGKAAGDFAEELFTDYPEARQSITDFKADLAELANELWENSGNKPLVVFIDELDRCRPSYAIELLEMGKHIFSVDHVVFILAVNRAELAHSVRVLYGDRFGAEDYLRRFFDIDILLPSPNRDQFIDGLLAQTGTKRFLENDQRTSLQYGGLAKSILQNFLSRSDLSLRSIGQSIHRIGLVLSSLSDDELRYAGTLATLSVIHALDSELYHSVKDTSVSDESIITTVSTKLNDSQLMSQPPGTFMQAIIMASRITHSDALMPYSGLQEKAPLFWHYFETAQNGHAETETDRAIMQRARQIVRIVQDLHGAGSPAAERLGFQESIQRLELLSSDFLTALK